MGNGNVSSMKNSKDMNLFNVLGVDFVRAWNVRNIFALSLFSILSCNTKHEEAEEAEDKTQDKKLSNVNKVKIYVLKDSVITYMNVGLVPFSAPFICSFSFVNINVDIFRGRSRNAREIENEGSVLLFWSRSEIKDYENRKSSRTPSFLGQKLEK